MGLTENEATTLYIEIEIVCSFISYWRPRRLIWNLDALAWHDNPSCVHKWIRDGSSILESQKDSSSSPLW